MNRHAVIAALLLAGCTRAQGAGWMPQLVLRAAVAQRAATRVGGGVERRDWRVQGDLRWRLDRPGPPPIAPARPKVSAVASTGAPACVDETICAWERRARARALADIGGGEP